ncbi:MAG TPA: right-handed parallel beta-helix repeat-containing protein [Bryobacteraceae bacterium]|nr:right-handed parallel beta-helix repeat-containing protein [Bryobacteraceae bacterium]
MSVLKDKKNRPALLVAIVLSLAGNAFGQATRTWVSGVGDDVNPCSRTAPCKTYVGAFTKTAAGGEINAMDSGGFGSLSITKSITIDGTGTMASTLSSYANGIVVNVGPSDVVTLRNLSINGAGTGISGVRMISGGTLILENVEISGHTVRGIEFIPSAPATLIAKNVNIRNNGGGVLVKPGVGATASVELVDVLLARNASFGLRAEDNSTVSVRNSVAANNTNNGFLAISAGGPVQLTIRRTESTGHRNAGANSAGVQSNGGQAVVRLDSVMLVGNDLGVYIVNGGTVASWGNNCITGNGVNGAPNSALTPQ